MTAEKTKKRTGFKLPHLMILMLGLLIFMSLMTFIIPAGTFATRADGTLDGSSFQLLGYQTPVTPWQAMLSILTGLQNSSYVIAVLLVNGGAIGVILEPHCHHCSLDHDGEYRCSAALRCGSV